MIVWRIANAKFATLDGLGGLHTPGRWHNAGRPIVYTADSSALAMLEVRVHLDLTMAELTRFVMLKINIPDNLAIAISTADPHEATIARATGDEFLKSKQNPVLGVRSALTPEGLNYLINPLHPDANKITILRHAPFAFYARLFK